MAVCKVCAGEGQVFLVFMIHVQLYSGLGGSKTTRFDFVSIDSMMLCRIQRRYALAE